MQQSHSNLKENTRENHHVKLTKFEKLSDFQTWRNFKNGSEEAYIFIYHKYFFTLYDYGRQFCNSKDLIKDCIQDLFIALWTHKESLGDTDSIKYYLFKSLKRRIAKELAHYPFTITVKGSLEVKTFEMVLPIEFQIISEQEEKEKIQRLRKAVNSLTAKQREVIFLMFYEDLSHQHIASILEVEVKTVRNLLWKAIAKLRHILQLICLF